MALMQVKVFRPVTVKMLIVNFGHCMRAAMPETPELSISPEKLGFVIAKAREFDVKDVVTDPDDSSNPTDDGMLSVLEDHRDDPVVKELVGFIRAMTEDEQIDLVALKWLGRGDGTAEDWDELRAESRSRT